MERVEAGKVRGEGNEGVQCEGLKMGKRIGDFECVCVKRGQVRVVSVGKCSVERQLRVRVADRGWGVKTGCTRCGECVRKRDILQQGSSLADDGQGFSSVSRGYEWQESVRKRKRRVKVGFASFRGGRNRKGLS